jgi:site-specific recombinase XerC
MCRRGSSEATGLQRQNVTFGTGAHIEVLGKGRKQRALPLCKPVADVLETWLDELSPAQDDAPASGMARTMGGDDRRRGHSGKIL